MGLFDSIIGQVLRGPAPQQEKQSQSLVEGLIEMLEDSEEGGVQGLVGRFQRSGLGDVISSWISTGDNRSITPQQILTVLGQSRVSQLAQRAGIQESQGASVLAALLPALIDKLTPDGRVPQPDQIAQLGLSLLRGTAASSGAAPAAAPSAQRRDFSDVRGGASSTAPAPAAPAPRTYTVAAGDSLSKIAKKLYGDANKWRQIFEANRDLIKDPDKIYPGQTLKIPEA